jgi:membrane protease YdiL (CAAX protease family)
MSDRRLALVFIVAVLGVGWSFEAFLIAGGGVRRFGPLWIGALMWTPGALSILIRVSSGSGFADAGLERAAIRYWLYALAIPFLLAASVAALSVATDIRRFAPISPDELPRIAPAALVVLGLGVFGAFGEELGWRGFLLPKLVSGRVRRPYLAVGLVWAAWHVPLIAFGGFYETEHNLLMAAVYSIGVVALSFFMSELRMRSGSVWVATIAHAAHNFFFQFAVPVFIVAAPGSRAEHWETIAGDTGLSIAALYGFAYLLLRRRRLA